MAERVPCENCGNLVAATSKLCPVCRSTAPNRWRNRFAVIGFIIGGVFLFAVMSDGSRKPKPSSEPQAPVESFQPDEIATASGNEEVVVERDQDARPNGVDEGAQVSEPALDRVAAAKRQTEAIGQALNDGQDVEWSAGGISGTIEVKTASSDGEYRCLKYRTVQDDETSGWSQVCETEPQTWTPSL